MKVARIVMISLAAAAALATPAWAQVRATARPGAELNQVVDGLAVDLAALEAHHLDAMAAAESLAVLHADLAAEVERVAAHAATLGPSPDRARVRALLAELAALRKANNRFNLQYLSLQTKMQDEARRFTTLSNIMKTKHETVKNSIQNIR